MMPEQFYRRSDDANDDVSTFRFFRFLLPDAARTGDARTHHAGEGDEEREKERDAKVCVRKRAERRGNFAIVR